MIRVNLLPQKREAARRAATDASQAWLAIMMGALLLEAMGLLFFHKIEQDELSRLQRENQTAEATINDIKRQIANHGEIKAQLAELREREDAIRKLQAARTGPTSALIELSRVLSASRGPTTDRDRLEQLKRDDPGAVPNAGWDPRRLWLTQYSEVDRAVKIGGLARDGEDVSEFLRRLSLSDYFADIKLLPAAKLVDTVTKLELIKFELSAKVRY